MTDPNVAFAATVEHAYMRTRERFDAWAADETYHVYVVPASTAPSAGFAIFYTPPRLRPSLLIVGQNPSNFAGRGRPLTDTPNAAMLAGEPPSVNSYDDHAHVFGVALRDALGRHPELHQGSVGMNIWHYQCVSNAAAAPRDLRLFCESTTATLADAMRPSNILCVGRPAFSALAGAGRSVAGTRKAETARRGESTFWYVPHLTGSYTRIDAEHDLPIVLNAMTA